MIVMIIMMIVMSLVRSAQWSPWWSTPPVAATATSGASSAQQAANTSSGQQRHFSEFIPLIDLEKHFIEFLSLVHENISLRPEVCACECRDVRAKRECLEQVKLEIHGNARNLRITFNGPMLSGPGLVRGRV